MLSWYCKLDEVNKLKVNSDKTGVVSTGTKTQTLFFFCPYNISWTKHCFHKIGVILHISLPMSLFICKTCQSCYSHLLRIGHIRKDLTLKATCKLIISLVLSCLDYCNSLLAGFPFTPIHSLQQVPNAEARLILTKKRSDHISILFHSLNWFPVLKMYYI